MSLETRPQLNPLVSVWLRPRKTIEYVVATQPTVLALYALGGVSGVVGSLVAYRITDWRTLLLGAIGGAGLAVLSGGS